MSECVVRMEMPRGCWCCPNGHPDWIYNDDGSAQMVCFCNICDTEEDNRWISETKIVRPSWCPIICQLPEGHGRLVEEKSVRWAIDDIVLEIANRTGRVGMTKDETMEYINNLCTIVPAEAERSET